VDLWELDAREGIRDLVARYTHLGDGGRVDEVAELFEPDGVLEASGQPPYVGREAIAGFLGGLADGHVAVPGITYVRHHVANVCIDVDPPDPVSGQAEWASGQAYWQVVNNAGLWRWGRYRDRYHRSADGRWRFAHRTVRRDPPLADDRSD